jgi:hypothetical protein
LADQESMPVAEALRQINLMAERVAMLHYYFAHTLVQELGDEQGRALVAKAIAAYGQEVGQRHRQRIIAAGFAPDCGNYDLLADLPAMAWDPKNKPVVNKDGRERRVCPLAKYWIDKGAEDLGRLYCYVDQAKFAEFDPECECRHLKNVLDGDDVCEVVARKRAEWDAASRDKRD